MRIYLDVLKTNSLGKAILLEDGRGRCTDA